MKIREAHRASRTRVTLATIALLAGSASAVHAGGGDPGVRLDRVARGSAQLGRDGSLTSITASDGAIIEFGRFDIPRGQAVRFIQPGDSARVLGRILSGTPSRIDGSLSANGIVYLVNPAGVVFGRDSVVNVGRLYAAAGNIADADFLAKTDRFTIGDGAVVNRGVITGRDAVHLIGKRAENYGSIVATGGVVTMSAGDEVFLGEEGGRVMVRVEALPPAPGASRVGVVHGGSIEAREARFTVGDVYSIAMTRNSTVRATDIASIEAGRGDVSVEGSIEVASADGGPSGEPPITFDETSPLIDPTLIPNGTTAPTSSVVVRGGGGNLSIGNLNAGFIFLDTPGHLNAYSLTAASGIVLRASSMTFGIGPSQNDVVRASGFLRILPIDGRELYIGVPGLNPGDVAGLVLPESELDAFRPGFSRIEFGNTFTAGITVGGPGSTVVFEDPVQFRTAAPDPSRFIRVNGTLRGLDNGSFTFMTSPGNIRLDGTIETAGGEVFFGYPVAPHIGIGATLLGDSRVDTTFGGASGGVIRFTGSVDGPFSLALNAGDMPTLLGGNIGGASALGGFTVESASVVNLSGRTLSTTAGAGGISINAGAIDLSGATLTSGTGNTELAFTTLAFDNGTSIVGDALASDVIVRGRTGAETLGLNDASAGVNLDLALLDGVSANRLVVGGASQIGDISVATDADVEVTNFVNTVRLETTGRTTLAGELATVGALEIGGDLRVAQDATGVVRSAGIAVEGEIDGTTGNSAESLTLDARGGNFALGGTVSGFNGNADATGLANVSFVNGQSVSLDGVTVSGTLATDVSGDVTAGGRVTAGALDLIANAIALNAGFDVGGGVTFAGATPVTLGGDVSTAGGDVVSTGDLTLTGAGIDAGAGEIDLRGGLLVQSDATLAGSLVTLANGGASTNGSDLTIDGDGSVLGDLSGFGALTFDGASTFGPSVGSVSGDAIAFNGETTPLGSEVLIDGGASVAFNAGLFSGTGAETTPVRTALMVNSPSTTFAQGAGDAPGRAFSLIRTDSAGTTRITGALRAIGDGTSATGVRLDDDVVLGGTIDVTDGAINLAGDLRLEGDSLIESRSGQGVVIAGDIDSAAGEANDLTLLVASLGVSSMDEIPVIVLGGDIGVNGALGDLLLNTTVLGGSAQAPSLESRRDGTPRVATVLLGEVTLRADGSFAIGATVPEGLETAGTTRIVADRLITGFGEKITSLGSLDITTGALTAVGDVSALNDLLITSGGSVLILLRDDAPVRTATTLDGVETPTSLADLADPVVDRGTGLVSGGLLAITGDVRTRTDPNATNPRTQPTFASLAALVEDRDIVVDGRRIRVTPLDTGISLQDLRLSSADFGELASDVLLDLFIRGAGVITPVGIDPSGQDGLGDFLLGGDRARSFANGAVLNRYDRATLARYGVPTRVALGAMDRWDDVLLYDDRAGDSVSADRIWAVDARSFARFVVDAFERDALAMSLFRERLAAAFVGSDASGVAHKSADDAVLAQGFEAVEGALERLAALGLSDAEFERSRSLLLSLHVVSGGVSERDVLGAIAARAQ